MSSDEWVGKKISDVFLSQEPALVRKQTARNSENSFEDILKEVGFKTGEKNNANELNVDQAVFIRDLSKILTNKSNSEINNFIKEFETHLEDEIRLKWSLMPTVTSSTCESARNVSQDSLIHLLLNIEKIQEKVINVMLDKLVEFSYCENTALYDRTENKTVACLIISQFRWLSKIINSEALADKLLELIEGTPTDIQRDIIRLLPDVINEFDHPKVAKNLGEFLLKNQELNIVILDTLTNLNIESDLLAEIRQKVIETISTANIEDLPVSVKFVLQDLTVAEAPQVISELQKKLDFNSTFNPIISSTPINPKNNEMSKSIESCLLTVIKHSLKFQKILCDAWIKYLELLSDPKNHKALDIFVILILISLEINERKLESLLRNKVKCGDLNEDLLQATFRCHHDVLQEYAKELLKVAELLLRAFEPIISQFACSIYINCFVWFDSFYKQEVIGNLITHVGNKSENEINTALNTLLALVRNHTQKMVPYGLFIKNLLDHLEELTLNQIRKVHEMLSILAYQGGREGAMLLDDMLIIIRKQLTNKNIKYRKMGVIGALMSAKIAAEKENGEDEFDVSINSDALEFEECYQHSMKLLELVAASTAESCEAYALFCDELSHIMAEKKLGKCILEWVGEHILSDFEETYIIDIKPEEYEGKRIRPRFDLDEVNEPVAVDLYAIVRKDFLGSDKKFSKQNPNSSVNHTKRKGSMDQSRILKTLLKISHTVEASSSGASSKRVASPLKLAPLFRLLRIFRQIQDDNLDAIDALLGCSIMLPDLQIQRFSVLSNNEKHMFMHTLFFCINWIRENINAFSISSDEDIRCNVLTRLQLLINLENLACKYIIECKEYMPPMANFDCDEKSIHLKFPTKKGVKRSAKSKKGKKKKQKNDENLECTNLTTQNTSLKSKSSDSESEEEFESKVTPDSKISKTLQPFFRELDIDVFILLQSEVTFHKRPDVFSNEKVASAGLHPDELKFLLDDLSSKLHHCFDSSTSPLKGLHKQIGFSNLESHSSTHVLSFCINIMPVMCCTMTEIIKYFKTLSVNSDSLDDSILFHNNDSQQSIECLNLLLKVLIQIMSCKLLNLNDNLLLLKKALLSFVPKLKTSNYTSNQELIMPVVKYLILFTESVPSLSSAANLIQLLSCILYYGADSNSKEKVSNLSLKFLKKKWCEIDSKILKPTEINANVKIILESYLKNCKTILKALEFLSVEAIPQLLKEGEAEDPFYTLNKSTLNCFYKIMFTNLASYAKSYFTLKHSEQEQMNEWAVVLKVFQILSNLLKCFGSRSNIGACLKSSREILHIFLRYGMPVMDKLFVNNKEEVICLMKSLQTSTRYLQHVCCHSKVLKDVSLIKQVPFLKKSLEAFVFRVKVMLAVNKCEDAFWLGNLKNRDLKGEEILSQQVEEETDDNNSGDDEENIQDKSDTDVSNLESADEQA